MRKSIYLILASLILLSCNKDDNGPVSVLGTWERTEKYTINVSGNRSHNFLVSAIDCEKDNLYQFNENNEFILNEGNNICTPCSFYSFVNNEFILEDGTNICNPIKYKIEKYELIENGTKIKFDKGDIWTIISLSESSLKISQPLPSITGFKEMQTTYIRK